MKKVSLVVIQLLISVIVFSQASLSECIKKSKKAEIEQCCNFPKPIPSRSIPACSKKYQNLMSDHKNHVICMADCQFVGLGFLKNGKIDLKNFRNTTANELGANEPEAQDTISRLAEMCVRIVREQATAIVNAGTKCNATAFIFLKCMGDGVFSNCPDKYWSTREICTKYDQGIAYCEKE
ncbi:general odorant-binding protein 67 [Aedes aegypti]|uniref:Uncharacterized protein n=1 Tax=Aedes aegypti TaxID=7159 RepID=A0A6I8TA65_AEDAE|nr:general odorant-binding protein 67 [Aedes aegypti]